jgi:hypothetical protein
MSAFEPLFLLLLKEKMGQVITATRIWESCPSPLEDSLAAGLSSPYKDQQIVPDLTRTAYSNICLTRMGKDGEVVPDLMTCHEHSLRLF